MMCSKKSILNAIITFICALGVGLIIGLTFNLISKGNSVEKEKEKTMVGHLDSSSPYYSIPKNTHIVAAAGSPTRIYAFIVKSNTNDQHYVVHLLCKEVEKIPYVDVVSEVKVVPKEEIKNL